MTQKLPQEIADLVARIPDGFTSGPWKPVLVDPPPPDASYDTFFLVTMDEEGVGSSFLEGGLVLEDDAENEANARLIALAPELAAALRAQQEEIGHLRRGVVLLGEAGKRMADISEKTPEAIETMLRITAVLDRLYSEIGPLIPAAEAKNLQAEARAALSQQEPRDDADG